MELGEGTDKKGEREKKSRMTPRSGFWLAGRGSLERKSHKFAFEILNLKRLLWEIHMQKWYRAVDPLPWGRKEPGSLTCPPVCCGFLMCWVMIYT